MFAANRQSASDPRRAYPAPDHVKHDAASRRDTLWARLPPGPPWPPLFQSLRYMWRPYQSIQADRRLYGNCYTIQPLSQPPMVVFSEPDAIREIFLADPSDLQGGEPASWLLGPVLGWNSLVVLDGERYRRNRRLMMPTLHGERLHLYARTIREITDGAIERWPLRRPFSLHHQLRAIVLEVFLRTIFGLEGQWLDRVRELQGRILQMADSPSAGFIFLPPLRVDIGRFSPWGRFLRLRRELASVLSAEIARCRSETSTRTDVLSLLVAARDENGNPMSEQELFDEMFTLLMAGIETTTTSLAWVFCHVLARPDVLEKVHAECCRVIGAEPMAPEHIGELEYLDAVIKESARLTPVTTDVARVVKKRLRIGGIELPVGAAVSAGIYLTHHRPDLWPDPEHFDPERFIRARPGPYTFFPFGGGERRCLGAAFSTYVMKVVIAQLLSRLEFRLAPRYRMRPSFHAITIAPSGGTPVIIDGRTRSTAAN
jgi:cytochrome P450 family 110